MSNNTPQPYTPDELESIRASASVNDKFGFVHVDYDRMKATADSIRELEEKVTAAHAVVAGLEKSLDQGYEWFKESQAQVRDLQAQVQRYEEPLTNAEVDVAMDILVTKGHVAAIRPVLEAFLANRRSKP